MDPHSVFFLGAGYVGRNVLDQLLHEKYSVTTLVRQPEQAKVLEKAGVKTISGTLNDLDLITAQTAQHEITINTASSDDLPSVKAILSGIRQRVDAGLPTIYIHTSGTGVLEDGASGMHANGKIYRDDTPKDIDAVAPTAMHRHVDLPVAEAAREFGEKAKIVIVIPPLIYGYVPAHGRHAFPLKTMVRFALKNGFAGHVGEGRNLWSVVHVKDLGRAYMTLLTHIENSASSNFSSNPYFFAENGSEVTMGEVGERLSRILFDMGKIKTPEARSFDESDYAELMGEWTARGFGTNSRSRAIRLQALGWKPKEKDIWTTWKEDEVPSVVDSLQTT